MYIIKQFNLNGKLFSKTVIYNGFNTIEDVMNYIDKLRYRDYIIGIEHIYLINEVKNED